MKPDIKFNEDSVEVEGSLTLSRINGPLSVTTGLTLVGLGESPANGFTHLVLKPNSLVFETFHIGGKKLFDVKKEIGQNTVEVQKVAATVQKIVTEMVDVQNVSTEMKILETEVEKVRAGAQLAITGVQNLAADVQKATAEAKQAATEAKKVAADVQAINMERINWKVAQLQAAVSVRVGTPVESLPLNTPVQQLVITGNKIAVRTIMQPGKLVLPGPAGTPKPPPGAPLPLKTLSEFDLVADNENLKQQVATLEQKVAALERRLSVLESKVK